MDYLLICGAAILTSGLTLFSGFGLGTLLMPVFALFVPLELAVGMTAIVHFANNLFKLILMGRHVDKAVALRFGLPAVVMALLGARLLTWMSDMEPLYVYHLGERVCTVTIIKIVIAVMMALFAVMGLMSYLKRLKIDQRHLPIGGALSGFFGGLSGHQGALRSAFLLKCNMPKEFFIGTGVVISCMVDLIRLSVYTHDVMTNQRINPLVEGRISLLGAACLAAFLGAFIGKRLMKKVTIQAVQWLVAAMLFGIALALSVGLL